MSVHLLRMILKYAHFSRKTNMIYIEQHAALMEDTNLKVASPTGSYEDMALIECYDSADPSLSRGAYQAQYVKYGNMVYYFNEPKELGLAILALDPKSTHSAASYVRMTNELLSQMNSGSLEPASLQDAMAVEQTVMEEQAENPTTETVVEDEVELFEESGEESEDVSPQLPEISLPDTSSTTPEVLGTSTSPTILPSISEIFEATTTPIAPDAVPEATTTEEVISLLKQKVTRKLRV